MNKKFLLAACLTAFSATAFANECPTAGFDGFSVGISSAYRIQTAKDKIKTKEATATYKSQYVVKTAAENKDEALKALADLTGGDVPVIRVASEVKSGTAAVDNYTELTNAVNTVVTQVNNVLKPFGLSITGGGNWRHDAFNNAAGNATFAMHGPANAYQIGNDNVLIEGGIDKTTAQIAGADTAASADVINAALGNGIIDGEVWYGLTNLALKQNAKFEATMSEDNGTKKVAATESEIRSHNQQGAFGLRIGYGHSFNKFHIGAELFGEMFSGKLPVKKAIEAKKKVFEVGGTAYHYDSELPVIDQKIIVKNKWALGVTFKPGVTYGNVLFYVPLEVNMTRYEVKFDRNAENIKKYEGLTPTFTGSTTVDGKTYTTNNILTAVNGESATTNNSTDTSKDAKDTVSYKKQKTRIGYAFGLGAAMKLNDYISVDFRGTYSPNNKLKIDTPAYKSNALLDSSRLGERHEIKLSNIKLALGVTWHIN